MLLNVSFLGVDPQYVGRYILTVIIIKRGCLSTKTVKRSERKKLWLVPYFETM